MSQEKTKLSRADRKQIEAAIAKAKNTDKRHKSAQDSIPFQRMFPDGICRVTDYYYSKTVQFQDINYQLNQNEDKTAIFDSWCDFLNYFDSSIHFQLSFVNLAANKDSYAQTIAIPPRADAFNQLRTEYTKMLQTQLARGNNGLVKTKFITFGVEADNLKTAKPRLERIEIDILNNFKRLGVQAEPLNGHDRLKLMHDVLHMDEQEPFRFSWDWLAPSGLSVKDFIAPSSFEFRTGSSFAVGKKYGRASFLQILAPELNDRMLADFLDMESSVIVSMHIQSVDQVKAIKTIKRKITDLDKMKIEEQKKAIRAGGRFIGLGAGNVGMADDLPAALQRKLLEHAAHFAVAAQENLHQPSSCTGSPASRMMRFRRPASPRSTTASLPALISVRRRG